MQKILDSIVHLVVNTSGMLNNVTSEMRRSCHYPTCHRCNALSNIRSAGIESGIGHSVEKNPMNSALMELCTRKSRHTGPSASEPVRIGTVRTFSSLPSVQHIAEVSDELQYEAASDSLLQ